MLDFYSMSTARLRAFHLLLMLSLLLTGAAGAGGTPLQPADCDHAAMAMDDAAPHAQPAGAAEPMHDCCEESATCSSDCRMSCAAPAAPAPQAATARRLSGPAGIGTAPRADLTPAPPDELLRPPRTRSL